MKVISGCAHLPAELGRSLRAPAVAIGNFDGVHRGHQELLALARTRARSIGGEAGVLTFDPHPAHFFAPTLAPPLLMPLSRRLELFAAAGMDFVVVEPFGASLARMEAEDFIKNMLARLIGARHVVIGYNFNFGRNRRGDGRMLTDVGRILGIGVDVVAEVTVEGVPCSSTKIREFVLEGRVEGARLLLGRPFEITGPVVAGAKRGRTLGFPTANIKTEGELLPRSGIYAAWALTVGEDKISGSGSAVSETSSPRRPAAVSVGTNPTFPGSGDGGISVEAHLIDFVGNLYDMRLRLEFVARLRDERRFDTVEALVSQIRDDVSRTQEICQ